MNEIKLAVKKEDSRQNKLPASASRNIVLTIATFQNDLLYNQYDKL